MQKRIRLMRKKANASRKTTAQRLKEDAVITFGKYGYEGTTIRTIARMANLTAGANYRKFRQQGESVQ